MSEGCEKFKMDNDTFLAHYGIMGQKWGVKNGPPYPLSYDAHSSVQKALNPKSALDNYSNEGSKRKKSKSKHAETQKTHSLIERWNSLDDKTKRRIKIAVATAVVTAAAVGLGAAYVHGRGQLVQKAIDAGQVMGVRKAKEVKFANKVTKRIVKDTFDKEYQELVDSKEFKLSDLHRIDPNSMTMSDHMRSINPGFGFYGRTQNCMFCTTNMALRMKGFETVAGECEHGWLFENLMSTFKGMKALEPHSKTTKALSKALVEAGGEGSYGNLIMYFTPKGFLPKLGTVGAHSVFYKVENGKANIYDSQSSNFGSEEAMTVGQYWNAMRENGYSMITQSAIFSRLDNCEPTNSVVGTIDDFVLDRIDVNEELGI